MSSLSYVLKKSYLFDNNCSIKSLCLEEIVLAMPF